MPLWTWKRPVLEAMLKIIQVGIVIIEDGRIRQSYETDVNPHERLDEHIKQLTGLTDARLKESTRVCTSGKRNF